MGYSIRTRGWRLTVWVPFNNTFYTGSFPSTPNCSPNNVTSNPLSFGSGSSNSSSCLAIELYDHRQSLPFDFNQDGEQKNVAKDPAHADVLDQLFGQLVAQYSYPISWLEKRQQRFLSGESAFTRAFF
jgi:hypothetical protein